MKVILRMTFYKIPSSSFKVFRTRKTATDRPITGWLQYSSYKLRMSGGIINLCCRKYRILNIITTMSMWRQWQVRDNLNDMSHFKMLNCACIRELIISESTVWIKETYTSNKVINYNRVDNTKPAVRKNKTKSGMSRTLHF